MIKRYYKQILVLIGLIIATFVIYNQSQENKMYEAHISEEVNSDISSLVVAIVDNQNLYHEILNSNIITKKQLKWLWTNNHEIWTITQEFEFLTIKFNRLDQNLDRPKSNGVEINSFLGELGSSKNILLRSLELEEMNDVIYELDPDLKKKMIYIQELNSLWLEAIKENITGVTMTEEKVRIDDDKFNTNFSENSISNDLWVNLVIDLDKKSKTFLDEYNIYNIKELLEK